VKFRVLDEAQCRALEPTLAAATPLAGGLYLPDDEAGNCPLFTRKLRQAAENAGVRFRFGTAVRAIVTESGRARGVALDEGVELADAIVMAAACDSVPLLRAVGIDVPIWPVKGYSATVTLEAEAAGPAQALMDEAYKTAITPFGRRLRIAGTAEIGNATLSLRQRALRTLIKVASDWYPGAARYSEAQFWVGARPMVPDGAPLLGATRVAGLYLNVGHGSTGWAMACGAGRVVADVVAGREPEISLEGLTLERYGGAA
jgi:D-amino-acid dehydrogenase